MFNERPEAFHTIWFFLLFTAWRDYILNVFPVCLAYLFLRFMFKFFVLYDVVGVILFLFPLVCSVFLPNQSAYICGNPRAAILVSAVLCGTFLLRLSSVVLQKSSQMSSVSIMHFSTPTSDMNTQSSDYKMVYAWYRQTCIWENRFDSGRWTLSSVRICSIRICDKLNVSDKHNGHTRWHTRSNICIAIERTHTPRCRSQYISHNGR